MTCILRLYIIIRTLLSLPCLTLLIWLSLSFSLVIYHLKKNHFFFVLAFPLPQFVMQIYFILAALRVHLPMPSSESHMLIHLITQQLINPPQNCMHDIFIHAISGVGLDGSIPHSYLTNICLKRYVKLLRETITNHDCYLNSERSNS